MYTKNTLILITSILLIIFPQSGCSSKGKINMKKLRDKMVKTQIEARGITNERVLKAMRSVERHKFIPGAEITSAYEDHPLPIGHGQTISQPYIVALMTDLCELNGTEKVLEIGTGSGYQAAVLSVLAKSVYSIEIVEPLGKSAIKKLKDMGYKNIKVRIGDGYKGWPEESPFDVIILTASPPEIPETLINQLAENGILVAPEGDFTQKLVKIRKVNKSIQKETITYVRFVPMIRGKK